MRPLLALVAIVGAAACVPSTSTDVDAPFLLVIETSSASAEVRAWDASGTRFVTAYRPAATVHFLGYARPLAEEGIDVGPDRRVMVVRQREDVDESWPIPTALRWRTVTPDCDAGERACEVAGEASLPDGLAGLRIERTPCPARLVMVPAQFGGSQVVSSVHELGDRGVLIGRAGELGGDLPPLLLLAHGSTSARALPSPSVPSPPSVPPLFFSLDGALHVTWGGNRDDRDAPMRAFPVTGVGEYGPPWSLTSTAGDPVRPVAITARTTGGVTTVALLDEREWLLVQEGPGRPFVRLELARPPPPPQDVCGFGLTTILELSGPREGLVAFRLSRIRRFELDREGVLGPEYGPPTTDQVCRSARAVAPWGDELISWRSAFIPTVGVGSPGVVAWRRADTTDWEALRVRPGQTPLGGALAVKDDLIYAGVASTNDPAGTAVVVWQRDRRRPDIRPRYCGTYPTNVETRRLTVTRDGVLVSGSGGGVAWLQRDAPP